ncbi:MAG TPA: hypothetical protein P5205_14980 [Candidatus Paceibacterota bacterium]|nr:hypothetical protein [Verrucomicrobiota bacterium]HSA11666.1 hypothetical protein [Candidatus Paceibacterota bacterium]
MKTNRSARRILRIKGMVICLAFIGMVGVAFWLGESLAARVGPAAASQAHNIPAPKGSFADLVAVAW